MAGNLISIIAITSKGRGGRQSETLPKSNRGFTIFEKQNARYRCSVCNTILPNNYHGYTECPFCHARNSIITIMGREIRTKICHEDMIRSIKKLLRSNPNVYSKKDLAVELKVSYSTVLLLCKSLSIADAKLLLDKRGRRKMDSISVEFTIHEEPEYFDPPEEKNAEQLAESNNTETANIVDINVDEHLPDGIENKKSLFFDDSISEKAQVAYELKSEGYRAADIASLLAVSTATVYWYIKKIKTQF